MLVIERQDFERTVELLTDAQAAIAGDMKQVDGPQYAYIEWVDHTQPLDGRWFRRVSRSNYVVATCIANDAKVAVYGMQAQAAIARDNWPEAKPDDVLVWRDRPRLSADPETGHIKAYCRITWIPATSDKAQFQMQDSAA